MLDGIEVDEISDGTVKAMVDESICKILLGYVHIAIRVSGHDDE